MHKIFTMEKIALSLAKVWNSKYRQEFCCRIIPISVLLPRLWSQFFPMLYWRFLPSSTMAESGGSTSHSSSSLSGGSGSEDQINWKERCHTLEASLHKFKSQAAKIRELLAQKVSTSFQLFIHWKEKLKTPRVIEMINCEIYIKTNPNPVVTLFIGVYQW